MSTAGGGDGFGRGEEQWHRPGEIRSSGIAQAPHELRTRRWQPRSVAVGEDGRFKSAFVDLGWTAAAVGFGAVAILGGGDDDPTHAAVCVDQQTGERAPDERCSTGHYPSGGGYHGGFGWYYVPYGTVSPRVGAPVGGGSFSPPARSSYITGGVSPNGGIVSADTVKGGTKTTKRGGFGSTSKGGGG